LAWADVMAFQNSAIYFGVATANRLLAINELFVSQGRVRLDLHRAAGRDITG
jgi:hypothetical protein